MGETSSEGSNPSPSANLKGLKTMSNWLFELGNTSIPLKFEQYWGNLIKDPYLPEKYGVRFRRHGQFNYENNQFTLIEDTPYFQSKETNQVMGGMVRQFEALEPECIDSVINILNQNTLNLPVKNKKWHVHVHFIRIPTDQGIGVPCPEG